MSIPPLTRFGAGNRRAGNGCPASVVDAQRDRAAPAGSGRRDRSEAARWGWPGTRSGVGLGRRHRQRARARSSMAAISLDTLRCNKRMACHRGRRNTVLRFALLLLCVFNASPLDSIHGAYHMIDEVTNVVANAAIIPQLAPPHCLDEWQALPEGIVGSTVLGFGTIAWDELSELTTPIEAAGLVIDYMPRGATSARRVALGFSEQGMWVEYQGEIDETRTSLSSRGSDR